MDRAEARNTIGDTIKKKRKKKNISQESLAESIGVNKSTVSRYEQGKMEIPASVLPLICDKCGFQFSDFFKTDSVEETVSYFENNIRVSMYGKVPYNNYREDFKTFLLSEAGSRSYDLINTVMQVEKLFKLNQSDFYLRTLSQQTVIELRKEVNSVKSLRTASRLLAYINAMKDVCSD